MYDYDPNAYDDSWDDATASENFIAWYRQRSKTNVEGVQLVDALTRTKESNVKTNEQLMAERDALLLKAAELEKRVTQRETYGTDPFKNGDMLKIMITYPPSDTSYTYVALKVRNRYYLSGKVQQRSFVNPGARGTSTDSVIPATSTGWAYDHFVAWLASGNASVWVVEKLKKVF